MVCEVHGSPALTTESVIAHAMSRITAAVGRFDDRVGRVRVRLEDVNGPKGGKDKRCTVDVSLARGGDHVIIRELSEDLYAAITGAAHRVKAVVTRKLEKRK